MTVSIRLWVVDLPSRALRHRAGELGGRSARGAKNGCRGHGQRRYCGCVVPTGAVPVAGGSADFGAGAGAGAVVVVVTGGAGGVAGVAWGTAPLTFDFCLLPMVWRAARVAFAFADAACFCAGVRT